MKSGTNRAKCVGDFVSRKTMALQKRYVSGDSSARATLASLRRLGSQGSTWMTVEREIYADWPVEELGLPDADAPEVKAVEAALQLYALHQQSKGEGVALSSSRAEDGRTAGPRGSFGRACRNAERDLAKADGIVRRLAAIETASDFNGALYGMRTLMGLIRSPKDGGVVKIDYRLLGEDLYWLAKGYETPQGHVLRDRVFRRWSRDYYVWRDPAAQSADDHAKEKTA